MTEQGEKKETYSKAEIEKFLVPPTIGETCEPFTGSFARLSESLDKEFSGSETKGVQEGVEFWRVFEEDHDIIPGHNVKAKVKIGTTFNWDGLITQIRVERQNSLVQSMLTRYSYEVRDGKRILYATDTYIPYGLDLKQVETHERGGDPIPFPSDREVGELFKVFQQPKPGEAVSDFRPHVDRAKKIHHPAIQVIRDGNEEAVLLTNFYTDTIPSLGITHLDVSLIKFTKEDEPKIASLATICLHGVDDRAVEPDSVRREFSYTDGKLTGRRQYVGNKLIYTDTYIPRIIIVDGKEREIFDIERDYEEWAQRESGRKGEYRRVMSINPKTGNPVYKFFEKE